MKKHFVTLALLGVLALPLTGCYTMSHTVGSGGSGGGEIHERQWFILWGLVKLNDVDSHAMAAGATDYTVTTEQSVVDVLINLLTGWITIYSREITVTK